MSSEESHFTKRPSKTTRSCAECRRRKVRCNWPSETAQTCTCCEERGLFCEQQQSRTPGPEVVRVTTRARLANLERNQSALWAAVKALQTSGGVVPPERRPALHKEHSRRPSFDSRLNDVGDGDDDTDESEDLSPPNAPVHLLQLFDNGLLNSDNNELSHGVSVPLHSPASHQRSQACSALRALIPSREDMVTIAAYASSWMPLYASLFPMASTNTTPEAMLALYDELQSPSKDDPVAIATLLLYIAMTMQHAPTNAMASNTTAFDSMQHHSTFVKSVSDTVEHFVIADDALAGTLEGILAALLFLRLQLGRIKVTKMWLLSRRVIALAELLGLPRAAAVLTSIPDGTNQQSTDPNVLRLKQRAQAWQSICAMDRIMSMFWSLPLATANYKLDKGPLLDPQGKVDPQSYLYSLADMASRVLELDGMISSHQPLSELFNAVMRTDHELRSLASFPGKDWWAIQRPAELFIDAVLQYWHQYFTVRTHLQLAVTYDGQNEQFAFNFITCLDASQELARRYLLLRPSVPAGFFANWVIDMQAFTGAVFLQLASYRIAYRSEPGRIPHGFDASNIANLIDHVVKTMDSSTRGPGGEFAKQAAKSIRSLTSLLKHPYAPESQRMSLSLPLIGTIQISRRSNANQNVAASQTAHQSATTYAGPQGPEAGAPLDYAGGATLASQPDTFTSDRLDFMDPFSYSMEILEAHPFLAYDNFTGTMQ